MDFLLCSASSSRLDSLYSDAGCDEEKRLKGIPPKRQIGQRKGRWLSERKRDCKPARVALIPPTVSEKSAPEKN